MVSAATVAADRLHLTPTEGRVMGKVRFVMCRLGKVLTVFLCAIVVPGAAYAQASIAGVVRTRRCRMPGVTVKPRARH